MLNDQLHVEHKLQNKRKTCPPVPANPSETHGLPCAFITHREDLRATETLLLWEEDERGCREKRGRWS